MKETNLYYRRRYAGPTGHQQSILKRRRAPASGKRFAEPGCKPLKRNICCPVALLSRLSAVDREQFEDFFFLIARRRRRRRRWFSHPRGQETNLLEYSAPRSLIISSHHRARLDGALFIYLYLALPDAQHLRGLSLLVPFDSLRENETRKTRAKLPFGHLALTRCVTRNI